MTGWKIGKALKENNNGTYLDRAVGTGLSLKRWHLKWDLEITCPDRRKTEESIAEGTECAKKLEVGRGSMCVNSRGARGPGAWLIQEESDAEWGQLGRPGSDHAKPVRSFQNVSVQTLWYSFLQRANPQTFTLKCHLYLMIRMWRKRQCVRFKVKTEKHTLQLPAGSASDGSLWQTPAAVLWRHSGSPGRWSSGLRPPTSSHRGYAVFEARVSTLGQVLANILMTTLWESRSPISQLSHSWILDPQKWWDNKWLLWAAKFEGVFVKRQWKTDTAWHAALRNLNFCKVERKAIEEFWAG